MFKTLKHFFIPHERNNHRSRLIHNSSLLIIIVLLLFSTWFSVLVNSTSPQVLGISYSISDQELLILINEKRLENGLEPLKLNSELTKAAQSKADHMFQNNYWAHFAPDKTSPWKFILESGYDYIYAGENLAKGFVNSKDAVDAWMNSPTHRDNILSSQYEDVGFAIVEGNLQGEETVLIVELFGQEKNKFLASADTSTLGTEEAAVGEEEEVDINSPSEVTLLGSNDVEELSPNGVQPKLYEGKPLVDIFSSTKTFSFVLTAVLLIAFILDLAVIMKRKIPRIVGDNLDHIIILSVFIVFLFIYNIGVIL